MDLYPIDWLTFLSGSVIAVLLTLAAMNLLLAKRRGGQSVRGHVLFAVLALAAAGTGVMELLLANARTAHLYGSLLQAAHLPVGILVLVIPWVVWFLFRAGRPWLAGLANLVWSAALFVNIFQPHSRVYGEITQVERLTTIGGAEYTWATGTAQSGRWIGYTGVFLTLLFVVDAAISLWRRGERRRSVVVGVCLGASLAIGLFHSVGVESGAIRSPYFVSLAFLIVMAGIAHELIVDAARAPVLEQRVRIQEAEVAHLSRQSMLREMSVGIAHELSQPISGILNNAQAALSFLNRDPPDLVEVREALVEIAEQDRHASEVVGGFARVLKAGERQSERVDLKQLVADVVELAHVDLERRQVEVVTRNPGSLPDVRGDRVLLSMILYNLVRNAVESMAANEPSERRLGIDTVRRQRGVEVTVSDLGPGIPEEDRERVFDPFFTTRSEGSGLGLAVSRTLAEMHGGEIWSSPGPEGRGTTMHLLLPTSDGSRI
jgi:signal transduction histidine kinase